MTAIAVSLDRFVIETSTSVHLLDVDSEAIVIENSVDTSPPFTVDATISEITVEPAPEFVITAVTVVNDVTETYELRSEASVNPIAVDAPSPAYTVEMVLDTVTSAVSIGGASPYEVAVEMGARGADGVLAGLAIFIQGTLVSEETLLLFISPSSITISATASKAVAAVAPDEDVELSLFKNGVLIGTIDFTAGDEVATMNFSSFLLSTDDVLKVVAPENVDGVMSDLAITLSSDQG